MNNVVVLFGTLKVQSFILTEVSDCGLLIVVTYSTFLKIKDMLNEQSSLSKICTFSSQTLYCALSGACCGFPGKFGCVIEEAM